MADSKIDNVLGNWTQLPNKILENLPRMQSLGRRVRLLLVIFRHTYGFHRDEVELSLDDFVTMTGMAKPHACKAIKQLEDMHLITKSGNRAGYSYKVNEDCELWSGLPKSVIRPQITKIGNPDYQNRSFGLPKSVIQITKTGNPDYQNRSFGLPKSVIQITKIGNTTIKENFKENSKETIKENSKEKYLDTAKKPITKYGDKSDHQIAVQFWDELFQKHNNGSKYKYKKPQDFANIKELLKLYDLKTLKGIMNQIFISTDPFYTNSRSIGMLSGCANKLIQEVNNRKSGLSELSENGRITAINFKRTLEKRDEKRRRDEAGNETDSTGGDIRNEDVSGNDGNVHGNLFRISDGKD